MEVVNSVEKEMKVQCKNDALRFIYGKLTNIKKRREKEKG